MQATARPAATQHAAPGCAPCADGCGAATLLLGLPGLEVTAVAQTDDGRTVADVITAADLH
ncbi:MAG: hypothetical protein ACRDRJ_49325, partial [Streptosporangiaceae bacterium]